ncbi:SurA N-terminal domain-containing protein [Ruania alkalisoli]|uniref:SurA N-terminal domain-containing protein n=1 Tax=Ruania alkalisoli TaxID=2779775 RepID=A0A7M1SQZ3_9MICO|nr:SurA N-terminal domain-containing protein [Ruania alkalisoli]QOR69414.1 SurA N-terminal domain-containing protein [Ruania alkalisoli]
MPRKSALAALTLAAAVALTGCSSDDGPETTEPSAEPSAEAPTDSGTDAEAPAPEDFPEVVAEVNGEEISRTDFVASYEGQMQQALMSQQQTGQQVDEAQVRQQVLDQMVNNVLLTQAAEDAGIEASEADVDATLDQVAAQNGLGSGDEVVTALVEQGLTEEDVRADAADQYVVNAFVEGEVEVSEPTEDELRTQYDTLVEQAQAQGATEEDIPPFEEARDQIAQQAMSEQQSAGVNAIITELRDAGEVTVHI